MREKVVVGARLGAELFPMKSGRFRYPVFRFWAGETRLSFWPTMEGGLAIRETHDERRIVWFEGTTLERGDLFSVSHLEGRPVAPPFAREVVLYRELQLPMQAIVDWDYPPTIELHFGNAPHHSIFEVTVYPSIQKGDWNHELVVRLTREFGRQLRHSEERTFRCGDKRLRPVSVSPAERFFDEV